MKYNTGNEEELKQANDYFTKLVLAASIVEIKKVSPRRSLNQNNYLYLLLSAFGGHFGYTSEESKTVYKRDINPDIYVYKKNGSTFLKSTADITKEDMGKSIDRFMKKSAEMGYTLPPATDNDWLRRLENDIEKSKYYL